MFFTWLFWAGHGFVMSTPLSAQDAVPSPQSGATVTWQDGDRVRLGGDVIIEPGHKSGSVVAVFGDVIVRGEVGDDVVAILGSVHVESQGRVGGDVVAIGGRVVPAEGAIITGETTELSVRPFERWRQTQVPWVSGHDVRPWLWRLAASASLARLVGTVALGLLVVALGRVGLDHRLRTLRDHPGESLVTGLIAGALAPVGLIGLAVTCVVSLIGLPLLPLIPVLAVVAALVGFVGFVASVTACGGAILRILGGTSQTRRALAFLVGCVPVFALTLVSRLVWLLAGHVSATTGTLAMVGFAIELVFWVVGVGAVCLTWMRRQGPVGLQDAIH